MEQKDLFAACFDLKDELIASSVYQSVINAEARLLSDPQVQKLIQQFQTTQSIYLDAMRHQLAMNPHLQAFSAAKAALYQHPKVQLYFQYLEQFNHILDQVKTTIFGDFIDEWRLTEHFRQSKFAKVGK